MAALMMVYSTMGTAAFAMDYTPPSCTFTGPAANATVSGNVNFSATASDASGIAKVEFKVDWVVVGTDTSAPYSMTWNSTSVGNGTHSVVAVAYDPAGNNTTTQPRNITVNNPLDTTNPNVSITSPGNNANVFADVTLLASASDNRAVAGVQFKLDGVNIGFEDTTSPYSITWHSPNASNGTHTLTAVARDTSGNTNTSSPITLTVSNDATPPSVSVTSPANNASVGGTVTVNGTASDNVGVAGVQFKLDGANIGSEDTAAPYSISWNTTSTSNGPHTLTAVARDAAGNTRTSAGISINVFNDGTGPSVSLTAPSNNSTVSGSVTIRASATDDVGVAGVQFKLDGVNLYAEDTIYDYVITWNTATASNGLHTITAVARDAAGHLTTSSPLYLTVSNNATALPVISAVTSVIAAHSANFTWNTNVAANSQVEWGTSTNYGLSSTTDAQILNHTARITGLSAGTLYHYRVKSTDAHGNVAVSQDFTFQTSFPTITITSPTNGSTVSGAVSLTASVNGPTNYIALKGVQFKINGSPVDIFDMTPPYTATWYTSVPQSDEITATMYDMDDATQDSAPVEVNVSNDYVKPTISLLDASVSGSIVTFRVNAADNVGVAGVQFLRNDSNLGSEVHASPWVFSWNTAGFASGQYLISAQARDAAGNTATSAYFTVTVSGGFASVTWDNVPPTIALAGATISGNTVMINVSANDNVGVIGVKFYRGSLLLADDTNAPFAYQFNAQGYANGQYSVNAVAYDAAGNTASSPPVPITITNGIPSDTVAPQITLTAPADQATLGGQSVTLSAVASDAFGVVGVQFYLNGTLPLGSEDTSAPYSVTTTIPNGSPQHLSARARDAAGNVTVSNVVNVNIVNQTPTTLNITAPAQGAQVTGAVQLKAESNTAGVTTLRFLVDGVYVGGTITSAPYGMSWDSRSVSNGLHTISAYATYANGPGVNSNQIQVAVSNAPPTGNGPAITNVTTADVAAHAATVNWTTDVDADSKVEWGTDTTYGNSISPIGPLFNSVTQHSVRIAGLSVGTLYHYRVTSKGGNGVAGTSNDGTFSTALPTVTVNAQPSSTSLSAGPVTLTANISPGSRADRVRVAQVQFSANGINIGSDFTAPYTLSWRPSLPGNYDVTAVALDVDGNPSDTSAPASVNVTRSAMVADLANASIVIKDSSKVDSKGHEYVSFLATSGPSVVAFDWYVNGILWAHTLTAYNHSIYLDLAKMSGGYTVLVKGLDASGIVIDQTKVSFVVSQRPAPNYVRTLSASSLLTAAVAEASAVRTEAPSPTPSPSDSAFPTPSDSASPTPSDSASPTPSDSASPTPSDSASPTPSDSASPTPSDSASPTPSDSASPTPSDSASPTPSDSASPTPSPTDSPTPDQKPPQWKTPESQCAIPNGPGSEPPYTVGDKMVVQANSVAVDSNGRIDIPLPGLTQRTPDFNTLSMPFLPNATILALMDKTDEAPVIMRLASAASVSSIGLAAAQAPDITQHVYQLSGDRWDRLEETDPDGQGASVVLWEPGTYMLAGALPSQDALIPFAFGEVYAYPNPATPGRSPKLYVEAGARDSIEVHIYNEVGEFVRDMAISRPPAYIKGKLATEEPIPIDGLGSGVYTLIITARQSGQAPIRQKIRIAIVR